MLTLNDGRSELWQWDTGRKLNVDADCTQVHFSNKVFGRSIDVDVVDGLAIIPDILLQTDKDLTAWAFVGNAENGYTKISKVFKVNKRNKPADYVFTATDQTTLGDILDRIEDLENRPSGDVSKEDIQNAVSDYFDKNPVSVDEKDPTVPEWAKQPEPPKVELPTALPNPHKLTFTGAVNAVYDGSEAVEVEIPAGGGGGSTYTTLWEGTATSGSSITLSDSIRNYKQIIAVAGISGKAQYQFTGVFSPAHTPAASSITQWYMNTPFEVNADSGVITAICTAVITVRGNTSLSFLSSKTIKWSSAALLAVIGEN